MKHKPKHVPEAFATSHYSAVYHTDVLVPSAAMTDGSLDTPRDDLDAWPQLDLQYLSPSEHGAEHEDFGFVHGGAVSEVALRQHAWPPAGAPDYSIEVHGS